MIKLYEKAMSLQQIGTQYGISRQTVSQRLKNIDLTKLERLSKYAPIDKIRLENLYAVKRLSISKISEIFEVKSYLIRQALDFYKIPERRPLSRNGKYVDRLKELKVGEKKEIDSMSKNHM